jgi:hypothetical protein
MPISVILNSLAWARWLAFLQKLLQHSSIGIQRLLKRFRWGKRKMAKRSKFSFLKYANAAWRGIALKYDLKKYIFTKLGCLKYNYLTKAGQLEFRISNFVQFLSAAQKLPAVWFQPVLYVTFVPFHNCIQKNILTSSSQCSSMADN